MKTRIGKGHFLPWCAAAAAWLATTLISFAQADDRLIGVWVGEGFVNTVKLVFRSDGRYQVESRTVGSEFGPMVDRGRYEVVGSTVRMTSYTYLQRPAADVYEFLVEDDSLSLRGGPDLSVYNLSLDYQLTPGSKADVLACEQGSHDLVRRWTRHVLFTGDEEWTFRPGGYYCFKSTSENVDLVEFQRGRYAQTGSQLDMKPYSLGAYQYEVDVFGSTLTLIFTNSWSGKFSDYTEAPGSAAEVAAKAAEAQEFLSAPDWQAGLWRVEERGNRIDLLLRPDGIYTATNSTAKVSRVWRGRYTLAADQMAFSPFVGQEILVFDEANFGMAPRTYTLDYYDRELLIIDPKVGYSQWVKVARQVSGSRATVLELAREAAAERQQDGWYVGIWEAKDAGVWMEFTFRPDHRYIAKSGTAGVADQVERGQYVVAPSKLTLAPYTGAGSARGFELDLYDGSLFLIGDAKRLVVVRKVAGSEKGVIDKTRDPVALKGERGSILGLWKANLPGEAIELVFRQDGQFRLTRCAKNATSYDYGLYDVAPDGHSLAYDSRFVAAQTRGLDFYGETMTIYGGLTNSKPATYTVNVGLVDAAIAASFAADEIEAAVNAAWLVKVKTGPLDLNVAPTPNAAFPDPNPGHVFGAAPTVFATYEFYRRLIPCFVSVLVNGRLTPLPVVDTQEWHFFSTGRVLVRFRTHHANWSEVVEEVTDLWGAYQIEPKPAPLDVLHCYADNELTIETDHGEELALTLENGRRVLFLGKEPYVLGDWAAEEKPIPCVVGDSDTGLINTGLSLSSAIAPDPIGAPNPLSLAIGGLVAGTVTLSGTTETDCSLVLERAVNLDAPIVWEPLRTNNVPAGPFSFTVSSTTNAAAFFRVHRP